MSPCFDQMASSASNVKQKRFGEILKSLKFFNEENFDDIQYNSLGENYEACSSKFVLVKTTYVEVFGYKSKIVCMYVGFFISQPQQHKSKQKHILMAGKKEAVKNEILYRTCKQYIVQI